MHPGFTFESMKQRVILILFLFPLFLSAQQKGIEWLSIEEAQERMQKEPKKIIMDVYTKWCGPCKMMMRNTFTNKDVIDYIDKHYYAVKFDAESAEALTFNGQTFENPDYDPNRKGRNGVHQFARYLRVSAYPTIMYMDEELNLLTADKGYKTPQQLELLMRFFAEDGHKQVTTQEEFNAYRSAFVPSFGE